MAADPPPPDLDVPETWRLVAETVSTPFDVRVVMLRATTRIYEDAALRDRLATVTGTETTWRFVFASRLQFSPAQPPSLPLTRLVTTRASTSFVDVLQSRGFSDVTRADTHRFAVDGSDVEATRYRAQVSLDEREVPVEAYFAVWPSGEEFLLGGGAYPLSVPHPETFDPEYGREELFRMMRSIR